MVFRGRNSIFGFGYVVLTPIDYLSTYFSDSDSEITVLSYVKTWHQITEADTNDHKIIAKAVQTSEDFLYTKGSLIPV